LTNLWQAKFANIRLAGNFFREFIAPVATRYRERIDHEAILAAGGTGKLKKFTVRNAWKESLDAAGQSGAFAATSEERGGVSAAGGEENDLVDEEEQEEEQEAEDEDELPSKRARGSGGKAVAAAGKGGRGKGKDKGKAKAMDAEEEEDEEENGGDDDDDDDAPKYAALNKVKRNKGDPIACRQAKERAKEGKASLAVRRWLFPPKPAKALTVKGAPRPLPMVSPLRFSDASPPLVLTPETVRAALEHLSSRDPRMEALITRVGADALVEELGHPLPPTQARLFNKCIRSITFTMVSVDAGNAFCRRLAIKVGVALEQLPAAQRKQILDKALADMMASGECRIRSTDDLLKTLLDGRSKDILFTQELVAALIATCEKTKKGKPTGYPHICGVTFPCGKNDDHALFLKKARDHANGGKEPVSAGYSKSKADFIIGMVDHFVAGKISGEAMAKASDREAAKMLVGQWGGIKGIGEWSAGSVLMHFMGRADVMLYGDLTIRNYINDL